MSKANTKNAADFGESWRSGTIPSSWTTDHNEGNADRAGTSSGRRSNNNGAGNAGGPNLGRSVGALVASQLNLTTLASEGQRNQSNANIVLVSLLEKINELVRDVKILDNGIFKDSIDWGERVPINDTLKSIEWNMMTSENYDSIGRWIGELAEKVTAVSTQVEESLLYDPGEDLTTIKQCHVSTLEGLLIDRRRSEAMACRQILMDKKLDYIIDFMTKDVNAVPFGIYYPYQSAKNDSHTGCACTHKYVENDFTDVYTKTLHELE